MKKLLAVILALCLLMLVGCNNTDGALSDNQSDEVSIVETITSEVVELTDENSSQETVSSETPSTSNASQSEASSKSQISTSQTSQNNANNNHTINENPSGPKYLNHNEITLYVGYDVYNGTEYTGQNYTDYGDFAVDLSLINAVADNVVWTTENDNVVTVDNGKVTPKNPGMTYVVAKYDNETFKCKVAVKEIRTFICYQYTDETIENNYLWTWDASFGGFKDNILKYKIVEYTYDFDENLISEKDVTSELDLKPQVSGTFAVDNQNATIKILCDSTSQSDGTSNIKVKLTNYTRLSNQNNGLPKNSVQWLYFKGFSSPKGTNKEMLTICIRSGPNQVQWRLNQEETENFYVVTKSPYVTFTYDDIPLHASDSTYALGDPNDFTWESTDSNIAAIVETHGSGGMYGGISSPVDLCYNRAIIKGVNIGTAYITVKYQDYEIAKVKVIVE